MVAYYWYNSSLNLTGWWNWKLLPVWTNQNQSIFTLMDILANDLSILSSDVKNYLGKAKSIDYK